MNQNNPLITAVERIALFLLKCHSFIQVKKGHGVDTSEIEGKAAESMRALLDLIDEQLTREGIDPDSIAAATHPLVVAKLICNEVINKQVEITLNLNT